MHVYRAQGLVLRCTQYLLFQCFICALRSDTDIKPRWSRSTLTLIIFLSLLRLHGEQD